MNNLDNWISIWIICFGAAWFPVITAPGEGLNSVFNVKVNALRFISTRLTLRGQVFDWDSKLQAERIKNYWRLDRQYRHLTPNFGLFKCILVCYGW